MKSCLKARKSGSRKHYSPPNRCRTSAGLLLLCCHRNNNERRIRMQVAVITAKTLLREGAWDPQVLCGPMVRLLEDETAASLDTWAAEVFEGDRVSSRDAIGAAHLGLGELSARSVSWKPVSEGGIGSASRYGIHPGDVLVSKALPVKAAWVAPSFPKSRIDGSCYAVRNLATAPGLWLTFCLNQSNYSICLGRRSGGYVLPRISQSELRRFPIPDLPVEFERLAEGIAECIDDRTLSSLELLRLQNEVSEAVEDFVPEEAEQVAADTDSFATWAMRFRCSSVDSSLVPSHVAVGAFQDVLRRRGDWRLISDLVSLKRPSNARLGDVGFKYSYLRLSDVVEDMRVPAEPATSSEANRNVFAEPIRQEDVFHSLLATSPRTVFVSRNPEHDIFPVDYWARLRFLETPGAWAMVLQTDPVVKQLKSLAMGAAQQFATVAAVNRLAVPPIPLEIRQAWDKRIRRWHERRNELDQEWRRLLIRVDEALKLTEKAYGPWVIPFVPEAANDT